MGNFDNYYKDSYGNEHRDIPLGTSPADAYVRTNMKLKKEVQRIESAVQEVREHIDAEISRVDEVVVNVAEGTSKQLENAVNNVNESIGEVLDSIDTKIASLSTNVNSRVDNIIAYNNDTEGNTELIDIRTGNDGRVYSSAGSAVRGQLSQVNNRLNKIVPGQTTFLDAVYNHIDNESVVNGYWTDNSDSDPNPESIHLTLSDQSQTIAFPPIELKAGVTYHTNKIRVFLCFVYDKTTGVFTRIYQNTSWKTKLSSETITPEHDSALYITCQDSNNECMVVNGELPESFSAYGVPIKQNKHTIITVKQDGTGDYTKVYDAVSSISDSSKNKTYDIHIYPGTYNIVDEVFPDGVYNNIEGIVLPDYVNLIGIGQRDDIILQAVFPDTVSLSVSTAFSTINVDYNNSLENITFIAYNCRYACHDDAGNIPAARGFKRVVKNCKFWHKGCYTDDGSVWKWCKAYAQGLSSGSESIFINCEFQTDVNIEGNSAWSTHGRDDMEKPSYIRHEFCKFVNTNYDLCATAGGLNDHVNEYVHFIGCEFSRSQGTGYNVTVNKEKYNSDGVYFELYGYGNKNCYPGVGVYASGQSNRLHFFSSDNN